MSYLWKDFEYGRKMINFFKEWSFWDWYVTAARGSQKEEFFSMGSGKHWHQNHLGCLLKYGFLGFPPCLTNEYMYRTSPWSKQLYHAPQAILKDWDLWRYDSSQFCMWESPRETKKYPDVQMHYLYQSSQHLWRWILGFSVFCFVLIFSCSLGIETFG